MSQHLLTLSKEIESFNARLFLKKYKVLFCYVSLFYIVPLPSLQLLKKPSYGYRFKFEQM